VVNGVSLRDRARAYALVTVIGIAAVWLAVMLALPLRYPYANDTAGYVEEAANLLAGNGLRRSTYGSGTGRELAPQPFFPPGFSIAIAGLGVFGVSPKAASLALSWASWALLTPAVFFALRTLLPGILLPGAIGITAATSPGLYEWGFQGLSDAPALLLSVMSIGALLRAVRQESADWQWALFSGLSAGLAYAVRNAAVVLPPTAIAVFGAAIVWRTLCVRTALWRASAWGLGFAAILVPLLVRNALAFGQIQPYFAHVGQSDYGWISAVRLVLWSVLLDVTGSRVIADLAWSFVLLAVVGLPTTTIVLWLAARFWRGALPHARLAVFTLTVFVGLGLAMVAIGRVRFDWVETTLTRYVMQYSWAPLGITAAIVAGAALAPPVAVGALRQGTVVLLCALLIVGHAWFIRDDLAREAKIAGAFASQSDFITAARSLRERTWVLTNQIRRAIARDISLKLYVEGLPKDVELISNFAPTLYLETGRICRSVQATRDQLETIGKEAAQADGEPSLVGIFVPTDRMLRQPDAGAWQRPVLEHLGPRFLVEKLSANVLIVRRPPSRPQDAGFR